MEVTTASTAGSATGSKTIADLIPRAAAEHGDSTAIRYKRDGAWQDVSYAQLAETVQEIGLGLIDLGIEAGDRVCILANTRPEWSYADMGATSAGAVVVPIYQTNSPEECLWVHLRLGRLRDHLRGRAAAGEDRRDSRSGARHPHGHRDRPARVLGHRRRPV